MLNYRIFTLYYVVINSRGKVYLTGMINILAGFIMAMEYKSVEVSLNPTGSPGCQKTENPNYKRLCNIIGAV